MDEPIEPLTKEDRQRIYLEAISVGCDYTEAARLADVDRSTAYRWRQDPAFMDKVRAAREINVESMIAEAKRRAMNGSDKLMEFMLCNLAPDRFQRTQSVNLNAKVQSKAELRIVSEFDADDGCDLV